MVTGPVNPVACQLRKPSSRFFFACECTKASGDRRVTDLFLHAPRLRLRLTAAGVALLPGLQMSLDPFDVLSADPPSWLSRFVREEVRPLLLQHREAALEALARWLAWHADQQRRVREWQARQDEFLSQLPSLPADPWHGPVPPGEGFTWCELWRDPSTGELRLIRGWMPPGLGEDSKPVVDWPLPPPENRDPSADECWASLLAVHDEVRDPRERIGPAIEGETYDRGNYPFVVLRTCVLALPQAYRAGLTEAHLPALRAMVRTATASLTPPAAPGGDAGNEPLPDGPFGTDGFRFGGVEVEFGRAARQRTLVLALWDTETRRPRPARLIVDVMDEVYGVGHDTPDATFRQLCADTNRRFEAENIPLRVRNLQARVQLVPRPV